MIAAWRKAWSIGTGGQTDPEFPFGFVQLSVWGNPADPPTQGEGIATVRWGQTANYGYVPNDKMPRTFMATAVDLGAYEGGCGHDTFPSLCIHPGWKAEVGRRLALGAMDVAYGDSASYSSGPILAYAHIKGGTDGISVVFKGVGAAGIEVRTPDGFEVNVNGTWEKRRVVGTAHARGRLGQVPAAPPITTTVTLAGGAVASQIRYLWSSSPCSHPRGAIGNCSIYAKAEGLPATPFTADITNGRPSTVVNVSNAAIRYDTNGSIVNAHSGNIVFANGSYFLYGEYYGHAHFTSSGTVHLPRLSVYTSPDMVTWSFRGLLHNNTANTSRWWADSGQWEGAATDSGQWWCPTAVYSKVRQKMLIWFTAVPSQCCNAFWGVAESSDGVHFDLITLNETGVTTYAGASRHRPPTASKGGDTIDDGTANSSNTHSHWVSAKINTPTLAHSAAKNVKSSWGEQRPAISRSKDGNAVLIDDDGVGYIAYTVMNPGQGQGDHRVAIEKLTPDLRHAANEQIGQLFPDEFVEGVMFFKRLGRYYIIYSSCCCTCREGSGAVVYSATNVSGPWGRQPDDVNCYANHTAPSTPPTPPAPTPPPPPTPPRPPVPVPVQPARFNSSATGHGSHVIVNEESKMATWSPGGCDEVALLSTSGSDRFWLVAERRATWIDIGWCSPDVNVNGTTWMGWQHGMAWVYRSSGLFKDASGNHAPPPGSQGSKYGLPYGQPGDNVTAIRHNSSAVEFLLNGISQGVVTVAVPIPEDAVGCAGGCTGPALSVSTTKPPAPKPSTSPAQPGLICAGMRDTDGDPNRPMGQIIIAAQGFSTSVLPTADEADPPTFLWVGHRWLSGPSNPPACDTLCRSDAGPCLQPNGYSVGNDYAYWIPLKFDAKGNVLRFAPFQDQFELEVV